jgi:hypothetical protein
MTDETQNILHDEQIISPCELTCPKKIREAAKRAIDFYLKPPIDLRPNAAHSQRIFSVLESIGMERILTNLIENLASANAMSSSLAFDLDGEHRDLALGIKNIIELAIILSNRALEIRTPQ